MTRGNDRCPCGSGLKFKRCCRNKGRDPETCHFCGKKEPERSSAACAACVACIEKQRPGGGAS